MPSTNFPDIRNRTAIHSPNGSCMIIPREGDKVRLYIQLSEEDVEKDIETGRLNKSIATIIRQQRHLATRVIISTQEPTVVPATFLDLASFIVCHWIRKPRHRPRPSPSPVNNHRPILMPMKYVHVQIQEG